MYFQKSLSADHVENKFEIYLLDQGNTCIVHQVRNQQLQ